MLIINLEWYSLKIDLRNSLEIYIEYNSVAI